jgi:hypothetical protein
MPYGHSRDRTEIRIRRKDIRTRRLEAKTVNIVGGDLEIGVYNITAIPTGWNRNWTRDYSPQILISRKEITIWTEMGVLI